MSEKKMTDDTNALTVKTPAAVFETFAAKRSKDYEIVLSREVVEEAVRKLIEVTGARGYHDAMELVWFRSGPKGGTDARESASMLLTLYRCARDGNVRPPINLEDLYTEKYHEMVSEDLCLTGSTSPIRRE